MKRLHLLRHAKSDWGDPALDDHERPLNARGRKACKALAAWLSSSDVRPELILCSTATRARETLERLGDALGGPEVVQQPGLYHASVERLRREIATLPDTVDEVLFVGHNPGLHDLLLDLGEPGPERSRVAAGLPTGALVTLEADGEWADLAAGTGTVTRAVFPREL